jgi:hypothetical protein
MVEEKEMAFLEELRKYENRWVAILESEDDEIIVGSGGDAVEAKNNAIAKGFSDVVLFWVRPFGAGRIN